ncbi:MAG: hypothetical protein ABH878_04680, partial [bacterium]
QKSIHRHKSERELYEMYYGQIVDAVNSGVFEGLVHLDYVRRSLPYPNGQPPEFAHDIFEQVAGEIARHNVVVEINTRGRVVPQVREVYPTKALFRYLYRANVDFTVGSDAHEVGRVGDGFNEARKLLQEAGVASLCYFKRYEVLRIDL